MKIDLFYAVNKNLSKLDKTTQNAIIELIFSFRDSKESVCVVFTSYEVFTNLIGNVPRKISEDYKSGKSTKFYVDLESLNTNKVRLYTNHKDSGIQLIGYYVNDGSIYETKIYHDIDDKSLYIKRYNAEMELIDDKETETIGNLSDWAGNKDIIDIALRNSLQIKCIKKKIKNQNYLLVKE
jgi:hypothetical protein